MEMEQKTEEQKKDASAFAIPGAIIIAGVIIAGAIMYTGNVGGGAQQAALQNGGHNNGVSAAQNIKTVSEEDHIRGSLDAEVIIVEFSDLECPFCKRFHATVERAVEDYDGRVAWVYRQFPLDSLHRKARAEAIATECVAHLKGNDAFWSYLDKIFEITPSNDGLDLNLLPELAADLGISESDFIACVGDEAIGQLVEAQVQDAIASGGRGTPYSVLIGPNGEAIPFSGAQPYGELKRAIDGLLIN